MTASHSTDSSLTDFLKESWLFKITFVLLMLLPIATYSGIGICDLVLSSVAFLFCFYSAVQKNFAWLKEKWFQLFLALWILLIIKSFFTLTPAMSLSQSLPFIRFALFALALQYWLLTKSYQHKLLAIALSITLALMCIDGFFELYTGKDFLGHHYIGAASALHGFGRAVSLNGKQNLGAITMMLMFPAIAYLLNNPSRKTIWNYLAWLLVLIVCTLVPLTGERNATLEMALGFTLLFFWCPIIRKKLLLLLVTLLVLMFSFVSVNNAMHDRLVTSLANVAVDVLHQKQETKPEAKIYALLMDTGWNFFKENPITGIGLKQFAVYCKQAPETVAVTKQIGNTCITNGQNVYLEFLSETGIIGASLFLLMFGLWLNYFCTGFQVIRLNPIIIGALIACLLRMWPLASTSSFFFSWAGISFWWMGGWVLAYLKMQKKSE
ncbi:MAG: O-antigen ligase family protein [Coxiellaceae bacterium]|nr:O-antigen ligase family protein [Coxiellaceae bacterium]